MAENRQGSGARKRSTAATILILIAAGVFWLLQPKINAWLDSINPPDPEVAKSGVSDEPGADVSSRTTGADTGKTAPEKAPREASAANRKLPRVARPSTNPGESVKAKSQPKSDGNGVLRDVGGNVYESNAGLIYNPGREHRRDHVLRHARDDLSKSIHGVFDDRSKVFELIDEAYEKVRKGGSDVDIEKGNPRTAYTVFMRRRIGYVGGQAGKRKRHPTCKHLKLVLEGRNVITAFPTNQRPRR